MDQENKVKTEEVVSEEKTEAVEIERKESENTLSKEVAIEKPDSNAMDYGEVIEKARLDFIKSYKVSRRNSYIAMGVVFLFAVASVIFITLNQVAFKIVGWSLVGAAVLGMLIYYIVTRNSLPNKTKEYIAVVNENLNKQNFSNSLITEARTDKAEKMDLADVLTDSLYKNLNNIASRNVVNGRYDGRTFKVADVGLYSGVGRNRLAVFVGKYVAMPNDVHFEGRYIINIRGEKPVDLPTDTDDLVELVNKDDLIIYGKDGNKPASDLGKEFINSVKEIRLNKTLLNFNLVIWGGHSSAYLSYEDSIMTLPFDKPFDRDANEVFHKNLVDVLEMFNLLTKKEK